MADFPEFVEAAAVRPGDSLVFNLGKQTTPDEIAAFSEFMTKRLPGVNFAVVGGSVEMTVARCPDPNEIIR